jgi:hypothetical protein
MYYIVQDLFSLYLCQSQSTSSSITLQSTLDISLCAFSINQNPSQTTFYSLTSNSGMYVQVKSNTSISLSATQNTSDPTQIFIFK